MPIANLNDVELSQILGECLTPSKEIVQKERLLGRDGYLKQIERALHSEGRHIFIFGDRGIGKTSLAVTAAALNNFVDERPIYVPCGMNTSFADVLLAISNSTVPVEQRMEQKKQSGGFNLSLPSIGGLGANYGLETKSLPKVSNITEALDVLRYLSKKRRGRTIVIVDEFDRIAEDADKILFSELIKNSSTLDLASDVRFIFCGIGRNVEELLGAHQSAGRYLEPVELEKLHHNFLWDIIRNVAERTGVNVPAEYLTRIGLISDGFPHFVHLIGQCMFWAMHDDPRNVESCDRSHYEAGIKGALQKTEVWLKMAYQKATEKTKNKVEYEEALWALADKAETRRQVSDVYSRSYKRIMSQRQGKLLDKETFNDRLLTLKKPTHGEIVIGHGAGWFSFKESVLRGYVRLKAETEGVELTPDIP